MRPKWDHVKVPHTQRLLHKHAFSFPFSRHGLSFHSFLSGWSSWDFIHSCIDFLTRSFHYSPSGTTVGIRLEEDKTQTLLANSEALVIFPVSGHLCSGHLCSL